MIDVNVNDCEERRDGQVNNRLTRGGVSPRLGGRVSHEDIYLLGWWTLLWSSLERHSLSLSQLTPQVTTFNVRLDFA